MPVSVGGLPMPKELFDEAVFVPGPGTWEKWPITFFLSEPLTGSRARWRRLPEFLKVAFWNTAKTCRFLGISHTFWINTETKAPDDS